ncbi:hypothetical protein ACFY0N_00380 [Streptomyces vinaceus]|uniref:hypothetical protein n=1 Tax=Streptomyces vinaceus TaxID=1960 RepID=UPI0036BE4F71
MCDVLPDGEIAGTALAVYEYDETGTPVGAPTFVDPGTGLPYVAQGVLQPCPGEVGCLAPIQFCFASTAQVDNPGRQYDLTFEHGLGFAVTGLVKDLAVSPFNVLWQVTDPDGTQFATDLTTVLQSQFPGSTVTVTPAGVDGCAGTGQFTVHIECLRLDQNPPTLLQLQRNNGRDLVQNAAFTTQPPGVAEVGTTPGNIRRSDTPSQGSGTFPDSGTVDCTNIADRGWETNDKIGKFEAWGTPGQPGSQATFRGTTPTPRGTPVMEINAFGSGATPTTGYRAGDPDFGVDPDTIWQTFAVPAPGNFTVKVVVGGRGQANAIGVKLSTGDVDDGGIGDVINTVINAPSVTNEPPNNSAGPWTTFTTTVPLAAGLYTLAFTGPDVASPVDTPGDQTSSRSYGGLFTDMRVFQDATGFLEDFTNDDDTCTVPSTENSTTCEFWAPRCVNGEIVSWKNSQDGEELTNAAFWAQVPAPKCCETSPGGTSGGSSTNLVHTYLVCGVTETGTRTLSRVVITDPSGSPITQQFIDTDGTPVTPTTWQPGACPDSGSDCCAEVGRGCYIDANNTYRTYSLLRDCNTGAVTYVDAVTGADVTAYIQVNGTAVCIDSTYMHELLCDDNGEFLRVWSTTDSGAIDTVNPPFVDYTLAGAPYAPVGTVHRCADCPTVLGDVCVSSTDFPGVALPATAVQACDGTVSYINAATGDPWPNTTGVVVCPPDNTPVEEILCDQGNAGQAFRRVYTLTPLGTVISADEDFDGAPYAVVGPVGVCPPGGIVLGEVCYSPPVQGPTFRGPVNNASPGVVAVPGGQMAPNFMGSGIDVTVTNDPPGSPYNNGVVGGPTSNVHITFSAPVILNAIEAGDLDAGGESWDTFSHPVTGFTSFIFTNGPGSFTSAIVNGNPDGDLKFGSLPGVTGLDFRRVSGGGGEFLSAIEFSLPATSGQIARAAVVRCQGCDEGSDLVYIDLQTGTVLDTNTVAFVDCPDAPTAQEIADAIGALPNLPPPPPTTLTSQARLLTDVTPWTPADVTGTLTGLSFTVLTQTATLVDQNGGVSAGIPAGATLDWQAEDANTLSPPASMTPAAGGSVLAVWTQR